jgi:hypothetical protein
MRRWTPHRFIAEAMRIHNGRYTYPGLVHVYAQEKILIHCPDHGDFRQSPQKHLIGQGCPQCGHVKGSEKQRQTKDAFIKKAHAIHGSRYDYRRVQYINNNTNVTIICPEHGPFEQTPGNHTHKTNPQGCGACAGREHWTRERFLREAEAIHGDKYDYSSVGSVSNSTDKVPIVCKTHKSRFLQSPARHIQRRQGCPHCSGTKKGTTETFITKARHIHEGRYTYGKVVYTTNHRKVTITCPTHGDFEQSPANHTHRKHPQGCPSCARRQWNMSTFIEDAKSIHGDHYDYSEAEYTAMKEEAKIVCIYHGPFFQQASVHLNGSGCPTCRSSHGHTKIREALVAAEIEFEEEYPIPNLGNKMPLRLDFAIFEAEEVVAAIEYHGKQHYEPVSFGGDPQQARVQLEKIKARDQMKREWCEKNGVRLLEIAYNRLNEAADCATRFVLSIRSGPISEL